ncbi:MAG: YfiR family protein [Desulfuromonadales bacterium]|nr:YfiR family protein [Desulfuromonadales bacterium]
MRACFYVIFTLTLLTFSLCYGDDVPQEFWVKANYLLNLPLFVELPKKEQSCASFSICLIGDTPLEGVLESLKGKRVKKRPLEIRLVTDISQMECCQVLFVASSERYRLQPLLAEAARRGILTISDMRDFVRQGGMIGLVTVNNRITYELNQSAARRASISFDTQLLKLANDVSR